MKSVRRFVGTLSLAALLSVCAQGIRPDDVLGEWEKQDEFLPPINLILSRDETRLLVRLRLSGVDLRGSATLEDNELRLELPNREPINGVFTSKETLKIRVDDRGEYNLTKKK